MDQTAPPSGAAPSPRPQSWPTDEWREPAIGAAIAALTLPAVTSALVGLLVLVVQGRPSWLLVALSALVTAVIGVLAAAVAFRRRDRRPVRLLAAVAGGWGVATLVAGVVVGLELETSERVPLAVMLVVGGAWTALFGLVLWLAWRLLPPGASDVPGPTPSADDDGTASDAPATGTAGGAGTGAAPRSTGRAPGVTSPGPAATDDVTGTPGHASAAAGADAAEADADQAALADWPEWGTRRDAQTPTTDAGPAAVSTPSAPQTAAAPAPATPAATTPVADAPAAAPAPSRPATPRRTASSATPPPTSVDDTMVVDGPLLDDDDLDAPEPPTATPARRSVSSSAVRGRRSGSGDRPTQRLSGRDAEGGPPTQRMPHVDR